MWSCSVKKCLENRQKWSHHITSWDLENKHFGITWCDDASHMCWSKLQRVFHTRWQMLAAQNRSFCSVNFVPVMVSIKSILGATLRIPGGFSDELSEPRSRPSHTKTQFSKQFSEQLQGLVGGNPKFEPKFLEVCFKIGVVPTLLSRPRPNVRQPQTLPFPVGVPCVAKTIYAWTNNFRGRQCVGWKKGGRRNLTPPKTGFWTPLRLVCFPPPSGFIALFSCTEIHDRAGQKLIWRGPDLFGRVRSLVRFLPPYVLHPPYHGQTFLESTKCKCYMWITSRHWFAIIFRARTCVSWSPTSGRSSLCNRCMPDILGNEFIRISRVATCRKCFQSNIQYFHPQWSFFGRDNSHQDLSSGFFICRWRQLGVLTSWHVRGANATSRRADCRWQWFLAVKNWVKVCSG